MEMLSDKNTTTSLRMRLAMPAHTHTHKFRTIRRVPAERPTPQQNHKNTTIKNNHTTTHYHQQ